MRFIFHIRYPASFFTLVDHLSRWHVHSRMWYYGYWVEKYGLTEKQRSLLEEYRRIREKYPWGRILDPIFMYATTLEEAWEMASSKMAADEVLCLKRVFDAFKDDFDKEWQCHDYLCHKKEAYERALSRYDVDSAFQEVQRFYGVADFDQEIDVYLLYNPSSSWSGGGAQAGIQIEESQDERGDSIIRGIAVLLHEAFHLLEPRRRIEETLMELGVNHEEAETAPVIYSLKATKSTLLYVPLPSKGWYTISLMGPVGKFSDAWGRVIGYPGSFILGSQDFDCSLSIRIIHDRNYISFIVAHGELP